MKDVDDLMGIYIYIYIYLVIMDVKILIFGKGDNMEKIVEINH